jgi:hypothetical protein
MQLLNFGSWTELLCELIAHSVKGLWVQRDKAWLND